MCHKLCNLIWGIWRFHRSKDFEAMKAGNLTIRPWLSCQYITIIRSWTFRLPCLKPKIPKKIYILFSTLILFPCKVNFLIKRLISPCAAAPAGHSQACWTFQDLHTGPTFQTLKMTSRKAKKVFWIKYLRLILELLRFWR